MNKVWGVVENVLAAAVLIVVGVPLMLVVAAIMVLAMAVMLVAILAMAVSLPFAAASGGLKITVKDSTTGTTREIPWDDFKKGLY